MDLRPATPKEWMLVLLVLVAALGVWESGTGAGAQFIVGVLAAVAVDGAVSVAKRGKWFWSQSGAISGLIVAMILLQGSLPVVVAAAAVAVLSKHLVKVRGRHVFNPAAAGIAVGLLAVPATWWAMGSAASLALVGIGGALIAWRMRRLHQAAAFFAANYAIAAGYAFVVARPLLGTLVAFSPLFFGFVMLAEPMTAPLARKGRIVYAALAAAVAWAFGLAGLAEPFVAALLLCNVLRLVLDRRMQGIA